MEIYLRKQRISNAPNQKHIGHHHSGCQPFQVGLKVFVLEDAHRNNPRNGWMPSYVGYPHLMSEVNVSEKCHLFQFSLFYDFHVIPLVKSFHSIPKITHNIRLSKYFVDPERYVIHVTSRKIV